MIEQIRVFEMKEEVLIKQAQDGDKGALKMLFEDNKKKIFYLAYQYVHNAEDAEDILQETFIKAFHSLPKYDFQNGTGFSPWLYRIGINCSIDYLRRNKRARETRGIDDFPNIPSSSQNSDPEYSSGLKEIRERIDEFLKKLTEKQRMIFVLKHYQELSTKEIAEYMNCSEGSVKKQLFRAVGAIKKQFRDFFTENNYEMQEI
jgi:RNA polymerase sigma-70 factor (ECF subfamily)